MRDTFVHAFPVRWIYAMDHAKTKKNDVAEHPEVSNHVGLLANEPPGQAELPFI